MKLTFEEIRENKEVQTYLQMGNDALGVIGFTEHGFAHAGICAATAAQILEQMGYDEHTITLAPVSYTHLYRTSGLHRRWRKWPSGG